jgi:hypothetical protein
MKYKNATDLTTNSSSMVYRLLPNIEEEAIEQLKEYGISIESGEVDFEQLISKAPYAAQVIDDLMPEWKKYEPKYDRAVPYIEFTKLYNDAINLYTKECINKLDPKKQWFVPPREDNEFTDDEYDLYESVSDRRGRLS